MSLLKDVEEEFMASNDEYQQQRSFDDNELIVMRIGGITTWQTPKHRREMLKAFEEYENSKEYLDSEYEKWFGKREENIKTK